MSDLLGMSGPQRLTSQLKVSLEATHRQIPIEPTSEMKRIEQFAIEMEQINYAFSLVKEIRTALESALRNLTHIVD